MGATGKPAPPPQQAKAHATRDRVEIAVVGAHLAGLPLNRELVELGQKGDRDALEELAHFVVERQH